MKLGYYLLLFIALFYKNIDTAGFLPNETVHLSDSLNEIQNLNVNDNTVSFDGEKLVTDKVIKNEPKFCERGIKVIFQDATLTVTPDQLLFLPKINQWVAAKDLKPNDLALSISGALVPIIKTEEFRKKIKFHDLTIQDQHNLFVTKLGILVHNEPVSLAFGLVTTGQIGAAAIGAVATSALAYLGYVEISAGNKTSNSPFPAISGCYTQEERAQLQSTEQAAKPRAASRGDETRKAQQNKNAAAKNAAARKAQETNAKRQKQPVKASSAAKKEVTVSEVSGSKSAEETKKAEDSAGVKDKAADSEKPADGEETKEEEKDKGKDPAAKTVEDLKKEAELSAKQSTKSDKVIQYEKSGGYDTAKEDFDALNPSAVKEHPNGTISGKLPDGREVNVRTSSKETRPTLEVREGKKSIKIRYDE